jgi:hypothetical protein
MKYMVTISIDASSPARWSPHTAAALANPESRPYSDATRACNLIRVALDHAGLTADMARITAVSEAFEMPALPDLSQLKDILKPRDDWQKDG